MTSTKPYDISKRRTSCTSSTSGTTSPLQTIQREEVGTILKVTPYISEGDTIQLKIEQEDSSPGAKLTNSADISTNKRSVKTTILIDDGGIIVLGGLMKDTVSESEDRIPVLGSIPLLGNLFKSRSGSRQKTNLLVFLRPKILRDQSATEATSASKYNEIRDEEKSLHNGKITLLPGEKQPSVPGIPPSHTPPRSLQAPTPQPAPVGAVAVPPTSPTPTATQPASDAHSLTVRRRTAHDGKDTRRVDGAEVGGAPSMAETPRASICYFSIGSIPEDYGTSNDTRRRR